MSLLFCEKGIRVWDPFLSPSLRVSATTSFFWFRFTAHLGFFFFSFAVMDGNNHGDGEETGHHLLCVHLLSSQPLAYTAGVFVLHFLFTAPLLFRKEERGSSGRETHNGKQSLQRVLGWRESVHLRAAEDGLPPSSGRSPFPVPTRRDGISLFCTRLKQHTGRLASVPRWESR